VAALNRGVGRVHLPVGDRDASVVPRLASAVSLPVLAVVAADRWDLSTLVSGTWPVVLAGVGIAYVCLARWLPDGLRIRRTLPPVGVLLTLVAVLSSQR
jgi:hypothetical protein